MSLLLGAIADDFTGATEEREETAKLFLLLKDRKISPLTKEQVLELKQKFPNPI